MNGKTGQIYSDVQKGVDDVISHVGKDIRFCMPLALGKPVVFINELYRRAKEDPEIKLMIITALPLEKPRGHTEIEKRFLKGIRERIFDGVLEFDYMIDLRSGKLPANVEIYEFFCKAGANLHEPHYQMNFIASNYTHSARDAIDLGANVFGQMLSCRDFNGTAKYSMGCNTDTAIEALKTLKKMRAEGRNVAIIGEANENLPFMYGDAVQEAHSYDIIFKGEEFNYRLFGAPKDPVALADHMIGLNVSTLLKDGGTIQVGIGALGDAIVAGLEMRNEHNEVYREVIDKAGITARYGKLIQSWGGTDVFKQGLYGSSEMFVDAFMQLYKRDILKRKTYDSIPLMKLINSNELSPESIPDDIIDKLLRIKGIHPKILEEEFDHLSYFGVFKEGLRYENDTIIDSGTAYSIDMRDDKGRMEIRKLLGKELKHGRVILGAFFVGPHAFYKALNDMSEEERQLFGMSGVETVNQLYGGEELRALQRKDARFINTGMTASILGSIASDQLQDGRVVSGIGGQYNFVSMAHALPDARLIMLIKSVKGSGKSLKSNIVFSYGHCSIPRHLRDIIVTEYGIADVRGKPDKQVIAELINVADSRFQNQLLQQAKKAGKIPMDYEIPEEYRNNTPEKIAALLKPYQGEGYFNTFPFGTDLSDDDIALGGSLKAMKALAAGYPGKLIRGILLELFRPVPQSAARHIERMGLSKPSSGKERILRKVIVFALRNNKRL